ncbi:LysE family translocator [Umezawaea sp. Da 62-37]|uniref:LysE family translocator n=1 Tax=Umezawaea sp. Da 62-37 TaxID=3075927 RepID=UPI0028F739C1|nr:LysE family translocator [Umezawaea sp. Da 62-37]WNV87756.1 LysE family translocator [Umezawaea sp. Da 62-37]
MPTPETLLVFAVVSAGIMLVPGPSNFFLLAHGISHGRRAALAAAAGIEAASLVRVLLAAAGLSAALAASAVAFTAVRWAGVAYLAYLGYQAFRTPAPTGETSTTAAATTTRSVGKGLLVGLGNPKMMVFYLAFLPQFIHHERGPEAIQILVLGTVFWIIGAAWDLAFACASGTIGNWLRHRPRVAAFQPRVEGAAYLGLASWAAITGSRSS